MWDDGGVGGGYGAEWMVLDYAYKRARKERKARVQGQVQEATMVKAIDDVIDEKLVLEWEPAQPSADLLLEGQVEEEPKEMSVDETLDELRMMIILLGQMQTLRLASAKTEIGDDEMALGNVPMQIFH